MADNDAKATDQIGKAVSHINRITRDCYKFLTAYYKRESETFDRHICSVEPRTIKDCEMMAEYVKLSDEETYRNFENAYNAYKELHKFILANRRDVLPIT